MEAGRPSDGRPTAHIGMRRFRRRLNRLWIGSLAVVAMGASLNIMGVETAGTSVAGWTATLSASSTSPSIGQSVTLNATANQQVGPTPYYIDILDQTTNQVLKACGTGITCSVSVTQTSATTHTYLTELASSSTGATPFAATSSTVSVTWSGGPPPNLPTVTAVSPNSGPSTGGTALTVTGTNFTTGAMVKFGTTAATGVTVTSATSLTATSPAGSGTVDVTVSTGAGTSSPGAADQFTYAVAGWTATLSASSTSPSIGQSVTLNATANQQVGPTPYYIDILDQTTNQVLKACGTGITCSVSVTQTSATTHTYLTELASSSTGATPFAATSSTVSVTWSGGPPPNLPTVTAVSPNSGPSTGGTALTVTGTNFTTGATVKFGTTAATGVTVTSATSLTATSPAGSGTVDVTVSTGAGTSSPGAADQFTYAVAGWTATLSASSTSPSIGQSVTLNATANQQVGPTPYYIDILDQTTNQVLKACGTGITCSVSVTQTSATTHTYLTELASSSTGATPFAATSSTVSVTWSGGPPPNLPTVTAVSPNSGPSTGGTALTVTGTNFTTGATVKFGTTAATGVTVTSATSLTATSPAGSGTVDVTVSTGAGTSSPGAADQFTYAVATGGPNLVQSGVSSGSGPINSVVPVAVSLPSSCTAGDTLIAMVTIGQDSSTHGGLVSAVPTGFQRLFEHSPTDNSPYQGWFALSNCSASAQTFTFTLQSPGNTGGTVGSVVLSEYSGLPNSIVVDFSVNDGSSAAMSSRQLTGLPPARAGELTLERALVLRLRPGIYAAAGLEFRGIGVSGLAHLRLLASGRFQRRLGLIPMVAVGAV